MPRWSLRATRLLKTTPICLWLNMVIPQKVTCWRSFRHALQVENIFPVAHNEEKSRLLLYVSYVLMSEWAYLCLNTIRRTINSFTCQPVNFCKFFSKYFNTKSGLSIHQLPTLPQKIDSHEGLSWCKKGLVCECGKMNFYLIKPSFAPVMGLFAAKCSAIWC